MKPAHLMWLGALLVAFGTLNCFAQWQASTEKTGMANIVVAGAGKTEVNGTYAEDGTRDGKPKFTMGAYQVAFTDGAPYGFPSVWRLELTEWEHGYYYVESDADLPPGTGWLLGPDAEEGTGELDTAAPAPTATAVGGGLPVTPERRASEAFLALF